MNKISLTTLLLGYILVCNYAIANEKTINKSSQDKEYKYYATVGGGVSVHSERQRKRFVF